MPPQVAYDRGIEDATRRVGKAPNLGGYPPEYRAGYREGLKRRSGTRRRLLGLAGSIHALATKIEALAQWERGGGWMR